MVKTQLVFVKRELIGPAIQYRGTERSTMHTYTSTAEIECKYNWGEKALTSVNKSREE